MADDFYSFDEALSELRLKEEELKRLVSEGEIRAFREGETMRLRRADVENLRTELAGGEVVDLGDPGEELVFEDDADFDDAGMATEEIAGADTLLDDDVEDVGEIDLDVPQEMGAEEDFAFDDVPTATTVASAPVRRGAAEEEETEGMGMRTLLIITALLLVLGIPVCLAISTGSVSDIARGIAGIVGNFDE